MTFLIRMNLKITSLFLLASISTSLVCWVYGKYFTSGSFKDVEYEVLRQTEDEHVVDLDDLLRFLRADDDRLIRFNLQSQQAEDRQYEICASHLEHVMDILLQPATPNETNVLSSLDTLRKAAKLVTMCSLQNPFFRAKIGKYGNGAVLSKIVDMLTCCGDDEAATAAEAIWILSFNNKYNHDYFVENGSLDKLSRVILKPSSSRQMMQHISRSTTAETTTHDSHTNHLAVMWSAAALQNLVASYCTTDSGHCWWLFDERTKGLQLHPESPLSIDGSYAAACISQNKDLVNRLQDQVCRGGMDHARDDEEILPSLATIHDTDQDFSPKVTTWSMAGLLKNLALYDSSKNIPNEVIPCLCVLIGSDDWLEASKASDALYRLGLVEPHDCQNVLKDVRDL